MPAIDSKAGSRGPLMLFGSQLSSPTYKVALMLALSGAKYSYKHVNLRAGEHKQSGYLSMNRFGQVPVLMHGSLSIAQSNVILDYLASVLGKFGGRNDNERLRALEWLAWEADRLLPGINRVRFFERFASGGDPVVSKYFREMGEAALSFLDQALAKQDYLIGAKPTIADIGCYGSMVHAEEGKFDVSRWPNVVAWRGRIQALKGFRAPYDLLPPAPPAPAPMAVAAT
jgi:glutathione S-transferase